MSGRAASGRRMALGLAGLALACAARAEGDAVPTPLSQEFAAPSRGVQDCSAGDLAMAGAPLFLVKGKTGERIQLLALTGGCRAEHCTRKIPVHVRAGDIVFGAPPQLGLRCVAFGIGNGTMGAGLIADERLAAAEPDRALTEAFLIGTWRDGDNAIRIAARRPAGGIAVEGKGSYRGTGPTPNEGGFSANATVGSAEILVLRDGACIVVLERRGPYLLASDNAGCGGHNVRFVGIYLRRAER